VKIAIATVQVPFISGGAEVMARALKDELVRRGFEADIVTIPFKWYPPGTIVDCMKMARLVDLSEVNGQKIDLVIAMKFPAYYIRHPNKVLWLLHQHRQAYELWGTPFGDMDKARFGKDVRNLIRHCDNNLIPRAQKIFTISKTVTERLKKFNDIAATPLYPPPEHGDKFHCKRYEDFIFCPGRIDSIKRQIVLVKALKYCKYPVKVTFTGGSNPNEIEKMNAVLSGDRTNDRVKFLGFVSNYEIIDLYSRCLAVFFGPYQEDYGFITLEAFLSEKPVITFTDSGGPLEFVNKENGFILDPDPRAIAQTLDMLYQNKKLAESLGKKGRELMETLNINWDFTIKELVE